MNNSMDITKLSKPMAAFLSIMKTGSLSNKCMAAGLANADLESSGGKVLSENLNYSSDALMQFFPSSYPKDGVLATDEARHPVLIANRAYALKMGNGDRLSGDGWKYRGRGLIQLTGKWIYEQYFTWNKTPGLDPDLLCTDITHAALSAYWYLFIYLTTRFTNFAEADDLHACRKLVNSACLGFDIFEKKYHYYLDLLNSGAL